MTDRELLELIASQVSNLTTQVDALTKDVDDRIENEVSKHEEIILRRI